MRGIASARVIALLLAVATFAHAQTANDDPNLQRLADAVKAISGNELPRAEELLNSVLGALPGDADALNLLGVVRAKQDRHTDAERLFRRALARSPSHLGAHINLGELLLTTNRRAEAMPILLRAYKLAPDRPEINLNLATLYAEKNNHQQAYEHLRRVPRERFTDDYFLLMLRTLTALKRAEDVEKLAGELESRLTSKPDDVPMLRALARVARSTGNLEKALSHLLAARKVAPNSHLVLYDFGVTALQMDLILDALPVFEQLHRDYPREPAYLYGLAAARWKKGETAEAARLMNSYVTLRPRDPAGFYLLGAALLRQEKFNDARVALQRSLSLKPDPDTEYLLATTLEKTGNRAAAIEAYRRIVNSHPKHAAAHAALGTAYREAGNFAEARSELEQAVALDAGDLRASYQLGLVYAKLGEKEAAKRMFDRADDLRSRRRSQETVILKLIETPQP